MGRETEAPSPLMRQVLRRFSTGHTNATLKPQLRVLRSGLTPFGEAVGLGLGHGYVLDSYSESSP